ncbi:MAG: PorV/PorQ family protein [Chitinispirillaceae bacterium]
MIFNIGRSVAGQVALIASLCLFLSKDVYSIGQSAVVTLVFPTGGRPTALGEAFTGLSDDPNATFYNPAGLGTSPMASSWITHFKDSSFTAVAGRTGQVFGAKNYVWAGSPSGIYRYNGKVWEKGEVHLLLEGNETLPDIAEQYLATDDEAAINRAVWEIQKANDLGMGKYDELVELIEAEIAPSELEKQNLDAESFATKLLTLPSDEQTSPEIKELISKLTSQNRVEALADNLASALETEEIDLEELTELTVPFSIAIRDTITALALDASERLWVGTVSGLWRYHNNEWVRFSKEDELPSDRIVDIAANSRGDVAIATDKGLALMEDLEWKSFTEKNGLVDQYVTSVTFGTHDQLYMGTNRGLVQKTDEEFTLFDTTSGLLSQKVSALFRDTKNRLWIGGENGVTVYTSGRSWKRYKFPNSRVHSIAESKSGIIWIGTNKGVITYKDGKSKTDKDGKPLSTPEWKAYHSKNALHSDNILSVTACGNDIWIATDKSVHQYDNANMQFLFFYEQLLPEFQQSDLWHSSGAFIYPTEEWGTLGFSLNYINMGSNEWVDDRGVYQGKSRSWEGIFGISYGFPVKEDLSLGLNVKYAYSALAPTIGGVGHTFAVDAGMLKKDFLVDKFNVGFMLQNMGPKIYYVAPDEADPIPFSMRLGLAYKPIQSPFHDLTLVMDAYREVVKNYYNKSPDPFWTAIWTDLLNDTSSTFKEEIQEINLSLGMEYLYADLMALRTGLLIDYLGERFEWSMGIGVKYSNLNFDFSYIHSPEGFMGGLIGALNDQKDGSSGARHGQWRLSLLVDL